MINHRPVDYSNLDRPEVLTVLFHPRSDYEHIQLPLTSHEVMIPVEENVAVGACFHMISSSGPNILFFHGNGEIVADYAELGPLYNKININFLAVDFRGYGKSDGKPTVTAMMQDCHTILNWALKWLEDGGFSGPLIVMGRSLGSASALEIASCVPDVIDGLIIESGFAFASPLLELLGISPSAVGFNEEESFGHIDKIKKVDKPTLVIHAEFDHIIPFTDGEALHSASPAKNKTLLKIPGANHNDIFSRGLADYLKAIEVFALNLSN